TARVAITGRRPSVRLTPGRRGRLIETPGCGDTIGSRRIPTKPATNTFQVLRQETLAKAARLLQGQAQQEQQLVGPVEFDPWRSSDRAGSSGRTARQIRSWAARTTPGRGRADRRAAVLPSGRAADSACDQVGGPHSQRGFGPPEAPAAPASRQC